MGPHSSGLGPHVPLNEYIENMRKIAIHLKVFSWFLNIQSHYTNRSWLMHIRYMNETTLIRCKEIKTLFLLESLDKNYGKLSFWGEQKTGRFLWLLWGFRWKMLFLCCSWMPSKARVLFFIQFLIAGLCSIFFHLVYLVFWPWALQRMRFDVYSNTIYLKIRAFQIQHASFFWVVLLLMRPELVQA
jgi:hypothetical protein